MSIQQWILNFLVATFGGVIGSSLQLYFQDKANRVKFKKKITNAFHLCDNHSEHVHGSLGLMYYRCRVCDKTWEN